MLADVAEEVDQVEGNQPLGVVEHEREVVGREIEKLAQLDADGGGVFFGFLLGEEETLGGLAAGIADQAGAAAD